MDRQLSKLELFDESLDELIEFLEELTDPGDLDDCRWLLAECERQRAACVAEMSP